MVGAECIHALSDRWHFFWINQNVQKKGSTSLTNCAKIDSPKLFRTMNGAGINAHCTCHSSEIHFWNFVANLFRSSQTLAVFYRAKPAVIEYDKNHR